jgi:hypothetical protein
VTELPGPGETLGGFEIERELGRGGMGVVYLARQLNLGRQVALKVITPQFADEGEFERRFEREARHAAAIDHPNVVPVYETGRADGLLYLAMRYVRGIDLRMLISSRGKLSGLAAAPIAAAVGDALDAAHAHGLIHRDVKPANILIAGDDPGAHVYLSDFGLTKDASSESGGLTLTGQVVGTVDYMAPEQLEGRAIDARTDVYALGCVLFQMLTGKVPYEGTAMQKMFAHASKPPPSLGGEAPDLAPAFDPVVSRAMAKEPDRRYPSAGDVGRAAQAAARGEALSAPERSVATGVAASGLSPATGAVAPLEAAPPAAVTEPATPLPPAGGGRRPLAIGAGLVAVAGVAVALILSLGGGSSEPPNGTGTKPRTGSDATTSSGANRRVPASGTYAGVARQRGARASTNKTYPISMTFSSSGSNVSYPDLGCTGRLVPAGFIGRARVYREEITAGPCDSGGTWRVRPLSARRLRAGWTLATQDYAVIAALRR